jgi:hypothetical protein
MIRLHQMFKCAQRTTHRAQCIAATMSETLCRDVKVETRGTDTPEGGQGSANLYNVVAKGVPAQLEAMPRNCKHELPLLVGGSVVHAALQHTAAVAVASDVKAVVPHELVYRLSVL